jgi:hypothetical protein
MTWLPFAAFVVIGTAVIVAVAVRSRRWVRK